MGRVATKEQDKVIGCLALPWAMRRRARISVVRWMAAALALGSSLAASGPARAQNTPDARATLGGLGGVAVYVDSLGPDVPMRGVTRGLLTLKIVNRLREANIEILHPVAGKNSPGDPLLYVSVTSIFEGMDKGCVLAIRFELTQTVRLFRNPGYVVFRVPTWSVGSVGVYTKHWREEVIEDVLALTDEFIDAYHRVNSPENARR